MKRNLFVYISLPICAAIFLAFGIWVNAMRSETGYIVCGGLLRAFALFVLLLLAKIALQDSLNLKCGTLFAEKRYAEERAYLEKVRKGPLSFLTRIVAMSHYVCACMALDDLPNAARIIDRLRHGGGAGWKYRTAYCYILIQLDGGALEIARTEYEEFRTQCAQAEIYRGQIEVLTAIFHRIFGTNNNEPLPEAAVNSAYPVVGRILGRVHEERAAERQGSWEY